jgi:TolB-like protein/Flp pilus assembly protein TadD
VVDVIDSVAVLPFENVGGDPDSEYLSDGVAETLINELSRFPDLKVIARSTTFRFKGGHVEPRQVGRDLKVGAVVTGRVSLRGDTLIIGAELIDVAQGTQLWGERYSTRMGDIFAVQEDIAGDISRGLRLKLAPEDETLLARRHTEDSEVYRLYLLSRHELRKGTPEGSKKAIQYAQQATQKDPTYAPAYVALANSHHLVGNLGLIPYREASSGAKTAVMKALELDETLAEAHSTLARIEFYADWDWARAESGFKRAIELNPNSADAHAGYGFYLVLVGRRSKEGIEHVKRAMALDPLSADPGSAQRYGLLVSVYYLDRQYDQALETARGRSEFDARPSIHGLLAMVYREKGMYEEAIAEARKGPDSEASLAHLGNTHARAGRVREARACLRALEELVRRDHVGMYGMALIYAGLGGKDQAFDWLERAYDERDKGIVYLMVDPPLDPLRSDPRFKDLLRRMNFPS